MNSKTSQAHRANQSFFLIQYRIIFINPLLTLLIHPVQYRLVILCYILDILYMFSHIIYALRVFPLLSST